MALKQVTTEQRWLCDLGDTKPTVATHPFLDVGAECYEKDSGDNYSWDGEDWIPDLKLFKAMVDALAEP